MGLKDIPSQFNIDSEEEVRLAVCQFFSELGFDRDEISAEDYFSIRLGHREIKISGREGRRDISGRSDILLSRNGVPLAIVETKGLDHIISDEDISQAISYARLLEKIAPFTIITTGRETKVFDTISAQEIDSPNSSQWAISGRDIPSISEDILYESTRTLIGVSFDTLNAFCKKQVTNALEDLRGDIKCQRKYIPALYVPRTKLDECFEKWLASDIPVFAVVGESGYGKTNFMCSAVEWSASRFLTLFYSASLLNGGILNSLQNDFVWEFFREKSIAYIVERFNSLCQRHDKKLIIFVDGLDEFNGDLNTLKNELVDISSRLSGYSSLKICISCKAFDWGKFIIEGNQYYNKLALNTFPSTPQVREPKDRGVPKFENVGFQIGEFSAEEVKIAIEKYSREYSLTGEFKGDLLKESYNPLMLRFIAEVYGGNAQRLPTEITSQDLFRLYWERKIKTTKKPQLAQEILKTIARIALNTNNRQVLLDELVAENRHFDEDVLADLFRYGVLSVNEDAFQGKWISFYFGKLLLYTYVVMTERWPRLTTSEVATHISKLMKTQLGAEVVEFFLSTIDCGLTSVLTDFAAIDFLGFVKLVSTLKIDTAISSGMTNDKGNEAVLKRMVQYADCYTSILETYFPSCNGKVEPFHKGKVGFWTDGQIYQLRVRTVEYPDPVVFISPEVDVADIFGPGDRLIRISNKLHAGGTIHLDWSEMAQLNPHKAAWKKLSDQVIDIFKNGMLDESGCPEILEERIWNLISNYPNSWCENTPVHQRYWSLFGFEDISELKNAQIEELEARLNNLIREFISKFPVRAHPSDLNPVQLWYFQHIGDLYALKYWLVCLSKSKLTLSENLYQPNETFNYLMQRDINLACELMRKILPNVIRSYRSLFESNFPNLVSYSHFYKQLDSLAVVEVAWQIGDFLKTSYVIAPSYRRADCPKVITRFSTKSISKTEVEFDRFGVHWRSPQGPFGFAKLEIPFDDLLLKEPRAIINRTNFPSQTPILDQAYQLIANELSVLIGDSHGWSNVSQNAFSNSRNRMKFISWLSQYHGELFAV